MKIMQTGKNKILILGFVDVDGRHVSKMYQQSFKYDL